MSDVLVRRTRFYSIVSGVSSKGLNWLEDNIQLINGEVIFKVPNDLVHELIGDLKAEGLKVEEQ